MSKQKYWGGLWAIALGGLLIRLISLPPFGFFCDVPGQLKAIHSNAFHIQFPGYVPFQLLVWGMARTGLTLFEAMWLISLACGMGSMFYVALAARRAVGEEFSLLAGAVMAFGILPVYFSMTGASYPTDMICVAGLLFHGWEFLQTRKAGSYYLALAWVCFGIMMRPLSGVFCCAGLAVLLWYGRGWRAWVVTAAALALTVAVYAAISLPYYDSLAAMLPSSGNTTELHELSSQLNWKSKVSSFTRVVVYPVYGFHVWLVFVAWVALRNWQFRKRPQLLFLAAFAVPYFLLLLCWISHAGYYCMLIPALVLLPACFLPPLPTGGLRLFTKIAAAFVVIALCQWLLIRPVPTTNLATGAANAYVLQYSRSGITQGMFETLAHIMLKNNLDTNLIPSQRVVDMTKNGSL